MLAKQFGTQKRWLNYNTLIFKGRINKLPFSPITRHKASVTNPEDWATYNVAIKVSEKVGLVFTEDQMLLGIDIDHCLRDGKIEHEEKERIERLILEADTYTEISPSNAGLHLFLALNSPLVLDANRHSPFECYTSGRFFTVTNNPYRKPRPVRTVSKDKALELLSIIGYPWKEKRAIVQKESLGSTSSDSDLLKKMFDSKNGNKIRLLYSGDISAYDNDDSVADMALLSHLAFWTGKDPVWIERIWLGSPLGSREKTQTRGDYRQRSIDNAIANCKEFYKSNQNEPNEDTKELLPAISHAELMSKDFPVVRFTVDPFFEQGTLNMVSAPPNTWKSWLLLYLAGHIVAGTSVLDQFPTQKSKVMIVNEEDTERSIQDRLRSLGLTQPSLPIYYRIFKGFKLDEKSVKTLLEETKEKEITVIIFDSLRAIQDADENDSAEMQKIMDLLKQFTREGITVIFTHHHRKKSMHGKNDDAEASRGSSAINAAVSGHLSLEETIRDGEKFLVVRHLKSKAGEKLESFEIAIRIGSDKNISFEYAGAHSAKTEAVTEAKRRILTELKDRDMGMGRKDFVTLKIGATTTVKEATISLDREGLVKMMLRKEVERAGLPTFSNKGKANENLYFYKKSEMQKAYDNF